MDQQNKQIITDNQYNDGRQSDYIINWITMTKSNTENRRNNRITEKQTNNRIMEDKQITGLREQ